MLIIWSDKRRGGTLTVKFPETLGNEGVIALGVKKALVLKLEFDFPLSWSLDLKASGWSVELGAVQIRTYSPTKALPLEAPMKKGSDFLSESYKYGDCWTLKTSSLIGAGGAWASSAGAVDNSEVVDDRLGEEKE